MIAHQLPSFAEHAVSRRTTEYERLTAAVKERLGREISRLETEASRTDSAAEDGRRVRTSGDALRRRADDLIARLELRLAQIDRQLRMNPLPPRIVSAALVMPAPTANSGPSTPVDAANRKAIERRGIEAVLRRSVRSVALLSNSLSITPVSTYCPNAPGT